VKIFIKFSWNKIQEKFKSLLQQKFYQSPQKHNPPIIFRNNFLTILCSIRKAKLILGFKVIYVMAPRANAHSTIFSSLCSFPICRNINFQLLIMRYTQAPRNFYKTIIQLFSTRVYAKCKWSVKWNAHRARTVNVSILIWHNTAICMNLHVAPKTSEIKKSFLPSIFVLWSAIRTLPFSLKWREDSREREINNKHIH
jgi:hypothetical protein